MIRKDLLSKFVVIGLAFSLSGVLSSCGDTKTTPTIEETTESVEVEESSSIEESSSTESEFETEESSSIEESSVIEPSTVIEESSEETTVASTEVAISYSIMYVTNCSKVRELPNSESNVITLYDFGTEVKVVGIEGEYSKIIYEDDGFAYIHSSLLSATKPDELLKVSVPDNNTSGGTSESANAEMPVQTETPAQSTTPTQNANGTISVYSSADGMQLTLTPNGKGWYVDQYGFSRDQFGNDVDPITGETLESVYINEVTPLTPGDVPQSGLTAN